MKLHVEKATVPWEKFTEGLPWSIALDGFVREGPRMDLKTHHINFNHHDGVARLETRSTCAQVLMAIRMGLFNSGPWNHAFVNDCDEDVCLSWWMLKHHYLVDHQNPVISRLVAVNDMLDTTGGSYPLPIDMPILGQVAWIFDPYRRARQAGNLSADICTSVIQDVEQRIMRHVVGSGESLQTESSYQKTAEMNVNGIRVALVQEQGPYARNAMLKDGYHGFIAYKHLDGGIRTRYTIGRLNPFVEFPLQKVWDDLNRREMEKIDAHKTYLIANGFWGGGDMIGGSPRPGESCLKPEVVYSSVEKVLST